MYIQKKSKLSFFNKCYLVLLVRNLIPKILWTISGRQQLSPLFYLIHKADPSIEAIIEKTAHIDLEIYGYAEPTTLTLQRLYYDADLASSPRHSVTYTASAAPFRTVNVTISDLVEADLTIYTLTVEYGVGEALKYIFHLNQGETKS